MSDQYDIPMTKLSDLLEKIAPTIKPVHLDAPSPRAWLTAMRYSAFGLPPELEQSALIATLGEAFAKTFTEHLERIREAARKNSK